MPDPQESFEPTDLAAARPRLSAASSGVAAAPAANAGRPWIGVQFVCAGKYLRVFRAVDGTGYLARCPTCAKSMWFRVGSGGSADRFFEVSCR